MQENQQESQITNPTAANEELLEAKEEIEFLRNLVESQKTYIDALEQELFEVEQELDITSNELNRAIISGVTFEEALGLTKKVLENEKSADKSELIAQLLTLIYNKVVKSEELKVLEAIDTDIAIKINSSSLKTDTERTAINNQITSNSKEIRSHSNRLRILYKDLGYKFLAFKDLSARLLEQKTNFTEIIEAQDEDSFSPYPVSIQLRESSPTDCSRVVKREMLRPVST